MWRYRRFFFSRSINPCVHNVSQCTHIHIEGKILSAQNLGIICPVSIEGEKVDGERELSAQKSFVYDNARVNKSEIAGRRVLVLSFNCHLPLWIYSAFLLSYTMPCSLLECHFCSVYSLFYSNSTFKL